MKEIQSQQKKEMNITDESIIKIIMGIYEIYKTDFIQPPYIQEDGTIRLLEGDYIILRKILKEQLGVE